MAEAAPAWAVVTTGAVPTAHVVRGVPGADRVVLGQARLLEGVELGHLDTVVLAPPGGRTAVLLQSRADVPGRPDIETRTATRTSGVDVSPWHGDPSPEAAASLFRQVFGFKGGPAARYAGP